MDLDYCKLTLVYPPASESALVELLLALEPAAPGFTTLRAVGHGHSFEGASHAERVGGQVARNLMVSILPRMQAGQVLERIRAEAPVPHLAYWLEPVLAAGRLA